MKVSLSLVALLPALARALPSFEQLTFKLSENAVTVEEQPQVSEGCLSQASEEERHFPHFPRPPPPPIVIDLSQYTIAQILNQSLHGEATADGFPHHRGPPHVLPLKKLAFLLNISDADSLKASLADESAKLTFLAPDDRALTPPEHREHDRPPHRGPPHHGPPHHGHDGHDGDHRPPHRGPDDKAPHRKPEDGPPTLVKDDFKTGSWWSWFDKAIGRRSKRYNRKAVGQEDVFDHHEHSTPAQPHPFHSTEFLQTLLSSGDSYSAEDDDDHERKKAAIKRIIGWVLRYHTIDSGIYGGHELADKSTIASSLNDTRIRISPRLFPVPSLNFNFYAHTQGPVVKAKNGIVYLISAPLLPPAPPSEALFLVPSVFSTLTSGLQRTGLEIKTFHHGDDSEVPELVQEILADLTKDLDLTQYTVFAPTNHAFRKLGFKLNAFLFSIFGRRILKDVLAYHIVKGVTLYSDFSINATSAFSAAVESLPEDHFNRRPSKELRKAGMVDMRKPPRKVFGKNFPGPKDVKLTQFYLTTLFNDTVLPVDVYEFRVGPFGKGPLRRAIWLGKGDDRPGSRVKVVAPDVPVFNGALHVVDNLINPFPKPEHHHDDDHRDFYALWKAAEDEEAPQKEDVWARLMA